MAQRIQSTSSKRAAEADSELARMRCYVPGPIADQISSGEPLESGECEVSVMFVDLRGYTAFAESLTPPQVFSFLNRYTRTVSAIVRCHGGFVVEFNGDGMMAVFGAPVPLPEKERAALRAAREISAAVGELGPVAGSDAERHRVGIGIATGLAFVGNIRAVDRFIWSAVGSTTNRASRLQSLTRDLDAPIIVDEATRRRSGRASGFIRHAPVAIKGLRTPVVPFELRNGRQASPFRCVGLVRARPVAPIPRAAWDASRCFASGHVAV